MPTAAQLHSRRGGSVTGSAPSLSGSASAASWASVTAPSALGRGSDVLEVRCTVQFKYAAPAFPALFIAPTPATVQLVTAAPSSPSSSSERPSEAGLWVQPAGHAARLPSRTDGGDVAAAQPQFRDVAHYNRLSTRPSHGDVYRGPTTTARPSTVRAVRRQVPAQLLQHQCTGPSFWLPLSAVTALHWHTRDEEDGVAPSRGIAASSGSSSGGDGSVPRVVVVLQCAGDGLGHAVSVPSVVRLDGLRYSDALALADAYDSVAESAPIPTNNNTAMVSRPGDQSMLRHNTPLIADAARGGVGKQVGAALLDAFPSPLAVHVDPASNTPGPANTACSSPASPFAHDRRDETGLPATGHIKSAAYATYARLLRGQAAWTDTTTRCTAPVRAANGTWGNHQDDDDDDYQRPTRNDTAPQSPTANPAAVHLFHSVASFGDSTMTLPDSSQATSALYSPLGIPRQESSCAAWSSQPRPSPDDNRLLSGAPPAPWSSGAITRAGLPFVAGETSRHIPRWFPPPPDDVSDVSETTVCSSRGTTPVGEPSVPSSALPATPLHPDSAGRHFATPHSRAAVTTSAPHAVPMTVPTPLPAATTPSAASAPPTGTLHWSPPPPQQQQQQPPPSLLPAPPVSQERVLGSLQCLTAEQRQLVDFDRLLRPTMAPPADAATSAFSVSTNGLPSSTGAPPPASQPQAELEQILLRLRSYSLSRHSLAPADEVHRPLTAAGATKSASLSLAGNDNDDVVSRFTLAAPVALSPLTVAAVPAQLQPAAPLPRRGTSPLGAGHGVPAPAVNAPPVGGVVPHRAHGPFAQPQQHPAALFLAQGGLRGPSMSARPMRHGTVPHPLHPPNLDSALVAGAVPNALVEGDCVDDRYAAAEAQLSGGSGGSGEAAAVTPQQGRSGTMRTRRGSATRPPQTPPRMLPRRPEPAKGPQPLALDGGAPLVCTPNDEEGSVPAPTTMAT